MLQAHIRRDPPLVTVRSNTDTLELTPVLVDMFPGLTVESLYDNGELLALEDLVERAQNLTPLYQPAPFTTMFRVQLPESALWAASAPSLGSDNLADELRQLMLAQLAIHEVSVETVIVPPPLSDGTSPPAPDLLHLDAAPVGLGVESVWGLPGGRGQDEVLADVERGWHTGHVEFSGVSFTLLAGGVMEDLHVPHGTQVLSTAVARENDEYGLGVAPDVPTVVLSAELRATSGVIDTTKAVLEAIAELAKHPVGSVLLLETQKEAKDKLGTVPAGREGPCEMVKETFDLIQLAVANHIVVVEAAGNGGPSTTGTDPDGLNLDDYPTLLHGDSGALLVGQSQWTSATGHVPVPKGCTGKRIDCFGWGDNVYAASALPWGTDKHTGDAIFKDEYTSGFGGTSAASAMVAGAALVVQGLVRKGAAGALGYLPPMQMRALLRSRTPGINTPLASGDTETIGVMPDLQHIGSELGLLPDLYVRDNVGDVGGPHTDMLSKSPDIILRTTPLTSGTPDDAYGEGSGTENEVDLSDEPSAGETDAHLYVRVRNRGGQDVVDAKVTVYYAETSTLVEPAAWEFIGSTLVDVPQGNTLTVTDAIPFPAVPAAGHYCLVATVEHAQDPLFSPGTFADVSEFKDYVRRSNNVAWRNFNVVAVPPSGAMTLTTSIMGAGLDAMEADMEFMLDVRLPSGATIELELPPPLLSRMSLPERAFGGHGRAGLPPAGVSHLGRVRLDPGERHELTLHIQLPPLRRGRQARHEVALVQLHQGHPVGRVTWQLVSSRCEKGDDKERKAGSSPPST